MQALTRPREQVIITHRGLGPLRPGPRLGTTRDRLRSAARLHHPQPARSGPCADQSPLAQRRGPCRSFGCRQVRADQPDPAAGMLTGPRQGQGQCCADALGVAVARDDDAWLPREIRLVSLQNDGVGPARRPEAASSRQNPSCC